MITMVEPEWDAQTRALVLDEHEAQSELCPLCGRLRSVCQAAENQDRFTAPMPIRCHAHTALLAAQKRVTEESNPQHLALLWPPAVLKDEETARAR